MGGTPFDLQVQVPIGPRLKEVPGIGFDHNFCLCLPRDDWTERYAARLLHIVFSHKHKLTHYKISQFRKENIFVHFRVVHPPSGRVLEVSTSQPGVHFYTSNVLDGSIRGKGGMMYGKHSAFCLETQNWPDAVNQVCEQIENCLK